MLVSVFVPNTLLSLGRGMIVPILPVYAASLSSSYVMVGIVIAAESLGTLGSDVPAGRLLNRFGHRRVMLVGLSLVVLTAIATYLAAGTQQLVAIRFVAGVGSALWNISRHAYLTEATITARRGRVIALFGATARAGAFVGPAIGGVLAASYGSRSAFLAQAIVALVALVVTSLRIRDPRQHASSENLPGVAKPRRIAWLGLTPSEARVLVAPGIGQALAQTLRSGRQLLVPLVGTESLDLSISAVGWIMTSSALLDMTLAYPAGWIMDRAGRKYAIVPSMITMAVGMVLLAIASGAGGLILAAAVIGIGNGLGSGTMLTLGSDLAPRESLRSFLGAWRLIGDGGSAAGSVLVGAIAGAAGLASAALAVAGMGALAATTFGFLVTETLAKWRAPPEPL